MVSTPENQVFEASNCLRRMTSASPLATAAHPGAGSPSSTAAPQWPAPAAGSLFISAPGATFNPFSMPNGTEDVVFCNGH
jgi:hypothetical protein